MRMAITKTALETLMHVLLSCQCPVSERTEEELMKRLESADEDAVIDLAGLLAVIERDHDDSPFHRLKEFCLYSVDDLTTCVQIGKTDVLRHFCTGFHWRVVEGTLPKRYPLIHHLPSYFVGHLLLPAKLGSRGRAVDATYEYDGGQFRLLNLYQPPVVSKERTRLFAVHFATVVTALEPSEYTMMHNQLEQMSQFRAFRQRVSSIDYKAFHEYGDYAEFTHKRFSKYYKS